MALDGTWYFSSKAIRCASCSSKELVDGSRLYFHSLITPVVVALENEHVIALEPEFILPQDGHDKQDCEMQAAKRWIGKHAQRYAAKGVTILGDSPNSPIVSSYRPSHCTCSKQAWFICLR